LSFAAVAFFAFLLAAASICAWVFGFRFFIKILASSASSVISR
jgi:hypothetical protein